MEIVGEFMVVMVETGAMGATGCTAIPSWSWTQAIGVEWTRWGIVLFCCVSNSMWMRRGRKKERVECECCL